ncbi:MAG: hypothetical protein GF350_02135, partial [Chitinivibrionales bacterium]|nr:hypothetical protein [Chitinivibrionales bacterium]
MKTNYVYLHGRSPASFHSVCVVFFLFLSFCFATDDLHGVKERLTARLDSIELEKQKRKREGAAIEKLEKQSALLKDSIDRLKKRLFAIDPATIEQKAEEMGQSASNQNFFASLMPRNPFDWIIVVIGGIAILCAIILVVGLMKMRGLGRKKKSPGKYAPREAP